MRYKSSLALILFMSSILFAQGNLDVFESEKIIQTFLLLIIPSILFFISINFVEYKTEKTKHPYWRIILFSLIPSLVLIIAIETYLFISYEKIIRPGDMAGLGWLFAVIFGPIIIGTLFLVFSLVPSLIFFKIKDNKRIQDILFYGSIILAIFIYIATLFLSTILRLW